MKLRQNLYGLFFFIALVVISYQWYGIAAAGVAQEPTFQTVSDKTVKIPETTEVQQLRIKYAYEKYKAANVKLQSLIDVYVLSDPQAKAVVAERDQAAQDTNKAIGEVVKEMELDLKLFDIDPETGKAIERKK